MRMRSSRRRSDGLQPSSASLSHRGERGFNLVELLMAMAMATIIFMAITLLYTYEARSLGAQFQVATMDREARFAMEHLRRDMMTLGSFTTPNSDMDGWVCPKPAVPIRAIELKMNDGFQVRSDLNPNLRLLSIKLFGSLDVKTRFRSVSIVGADVILEDEGNLPKTQNQWDAMFATDRFLRISGPAGRMMFYPIKATNFSAKKITLASTPPRVSSGQLCGYQGTGTGLSIDVQGFVRYRIIADARPGSPKDSKGRATRTLLVRERLATDGITVAGALPLAENAVEIGIYDAIFDTNPDPDKVGPSNLPDFEKSGLINTSGAGRLGATGTPVPERLRALNVVLSLRTDLPVRGRIHNPRTHTQSPLVTYQLDLNDDGVCPIHTVAGRIAMPTMVARNL
ncbi:MAG: prepilin-type N-terminal cleavage/methylation domain-containing protein [Myxococcales bacterium]|nr:prepilin-type N-terminal cleavage/methylation domain-containing protein [Myxococcales bacterium]